GLGKMLGVPTDRAGRVLVEPDLSVPGHPEVLIAGDQAASQIVDAKTAGEKQGTGSVIPSATRWVPGVAPAAIQMGKFAALQIKRSLAGKPRERFVYWDKGSLATIGRSRAVADFGRVHISGYFAWLAWLFIHLTFLIGFRNRLLVMSEWAWAYLTYNQA